MSTLLKALRRAEQPQYRSHLSAMGLPASQEEEPARRWIWWLLPPLALVMGAGANYGWHLHNNRPIEKKVEVKQVVTPAFVRVEPRPMITRPLPPPLPEPVVMPKASSDPDATVSTGKGNGSQELAARLMSAFNNTPLQADPVPDAAPAAPDSAQAVPLAALPPALKQQVPALAYGSHVYSSNPAKRAVLLNGREYHEGSEIAPNVRLIAIAQEFILLQVDGQNASLKALQDWQG